MSIGQILPCGARVVCIKDEYYLTDKYGHRWFKA